MCEANLQTVKCTEAKIYLSNTPQVSMGSKLLYNNQINARALIGRSAVGYCYYKSTEKSRVF